MKYYTKEWYKAMQNQDYLVDVEVIEDREYNENDIMELYEDALRKVIEELRKSIIQVRFFQFLLKIFKMRIFD